MSNEKERGGAERIENPYPNNPPQGKAGSGKTIPTYTNLITQIIMLLGSAIIGFTFSESEVGAAVSAAFGVFAFGLAVRDKLKGGVKFGWLEWLKQPNTYTRIGVILVALAPGLSPEFANLLRDLVKGLTEQNWQLVFTAALPLLSILFTFVKNLLSKPKGTA
jgi:hypothetical protein